MIEQITQQIIVYIETYKKLINLTKNHKKISFEFFAESISFSLKC